MWLLLCCLKAYCFKVIDGLILYTFPAGVTSIAPAEFTAVIDECSWRNGREEIMHQQIDGHLPL